MRKFVSTQLSICRCPCSPALSIDCLIKCISRLCGHFDEEVTENDCRVIGLDVTCGVSKPLPATFVVRHAVCVRGFNTRYSWEDFHCPRLPLKGRPVLPVYCWKKRIHWFSLGPSVRVWHRRSSFFSACGAHCTSSWSRYAMWAPQVASHVARLLVCDKNRIGSGRCWLICKSTNWSCCVFRGEDI